MSGFNLLKTEKKEDGLYTSKIKIPIYEPKKKCPHVLELVNHKKTKKLIRDIENSTVTDREKEFLIKASQRHLVFNYESCADYYAHASKEMQKLMEDSALVLVDFERAIELGYIKFSKEIKNQFLTDYPDEE